MTKRQETALTRVADRASAYTAARAALQKADTARWRAAAAAVRAGVTQRRVAAELGVAESLLSRRLDELATASTLRKRAAVQRAGAGTPRPGTVPAEPVRTPAEQLVAVEPGSRRPVSRYSARRTVFVDVSRGLRLADTLTMARQPKAELWRPERVFLCGPAPTTGQGVSEVEGVRSWFLAVPEGWRAERTYLPDSREASGVYVHEASGMKVELLRAVTWTGDESASAAATGDAWGLLATAVDSAWRRHGGATLLSTPGTTGRDLWLRTIPEGVEHPVLSPELRGLIGGAGSSGQGRAELLPAPAPGAVCDELTELDGLLMYAGLTWGMGVGAPTWHAGEVAPELLRQRGRWRVTATVPEGWAHVGLLPARQAGSDKLWTFPRTPGESFTTWADGSEVQMALEQGWSVQVLEGFTQREGKPLNVWTKQLLAVHDGLAGDDEAHRLARRMVRAMLLFTIGAFAQRPRTVTRTAPLSAAATLPGDVDRRIVGDTLVWEETAELSEWTARTLHPEWSATVWARARRRLLTAPDGTGALHVPFGDVVAFRTDALYLARDPGWPEGDKPGRFRRKWKATAPVPWPTDTAALLALRG